MNTLDKYTKNKIFDIVYYDNHNKLMNELKQVLKYRLMFLKYIRHIFEEMEYDETLERCRINMSDEYYQHLRILKKSGVYSFSSRILNAFKMLDDEINYSTSGALIFIGVLENIYGNVIREE